MDLSVAVPASSPVRPPAELRYLLRATRWQPIVLGGAIGLALGAVDRLVGQPPGPMTLLTAVVAIAIGAASVADDAAASTLAPSPTSLRRRSLHRFLLAAVVAVACWLPLSLQSVREAALGDLTLQLAALLVLAVATATVAASRPGATRPGALGALVPAGFAVAAAFLPERATLLGPGGAAAPSGFVLRWLLLAAAGIGLLWWATRDPARR